ncbi:phosphonopyruvate decarboxylase [Pseudomaricurvus alkylphenolicus]|uniref:phosphonopyruvate decarboxylase n=1 Tax=Pseudomaricurvus alkylphenolicus TaxID=1306991 RepID=UPI00142025E3|nr:phosphonopyruvate decarboxylase [Pseudomaricurvus alkylphenolicus]NIB40036.1 phosphonopyruvate decarboxylase [Pseudomaricurvus alkylphenolicus]
MLAPDDFCEQLKRLGVHYYAGVPDSLLKNFCSCIADYVDDKNHIITANEGGAIALAIGNYLATGNVPLVYLQNSGLGNIINPLLSLADKEVYSIPMLLLVGWRGEPGVSDEPQHIKQGRVTTSLLEAMEIPYSIIDGEDTQALQLVAQAVKSAKQNSSPHALLVRKNSFFEYSSKKAQNSRYELTREEVVHSVVRESSDRDLIVATTGMASRELFEHRFHSGQSHDRDFLTVGGMGHASHIAVAIAEQQPDRQVICIDGDGAALMHLGAFAINAAKRQAGFKHIIINNAAHDSVGAQPTQGFSIDFVGLATASGYRYADRCERRCDLALKLNQLFSQSGAGLLEVRTRPGYRHDIGRPTTTPDENKQAFMNYIRSTSIP